MSTNNFSYENICVVVEDNDGYDFDDMVRDMGDTLEDKVMDFTREVKRNWTKNEAMIIGEVRIYKDNGEYYASVYATIKSGYYADACLDYVVEYSEYLDDNKHLKTLDKKIESKCRQIAKVLRMHGTEVRRVATFSNGEAIYEKIKQK